MPAISTNLIAVSRYTLLRARQEILGCEWCADEAEIPFFWVLGRVTGHSGSLTNYLMSEAAPCPRCLQPVLEDTLVEWE